MNLAISITRILVPGVIALNLGSARLACAGEPAPVDVTLRVVTREPAPYRVPRELTGKFCEHLGANIYGGMDAQILRNPTFADYPFWTGQMTPDGITTFHFERERIEGELRRQAIRSGWPESELAELFVARNDGLASFWSRSGPHDAVHLSPDTGPYGGRAQRVEFKTRAGIKQWCWLPLHRTRAYQFELLARSPDLKSLTLAIAAKATDSPLVSAAVNGLSTEWKQISGTIILPADAALASAFCLSLSSETAGQLVIRHLFLRPADHINGADPDVVRFLKASHLPLLRWPGGNFVSAYHWQDGIGPSERRPTLPNFAWGGIEPNTFGTDEFISFCRAVGCEPMICVNGGTGTPEEAARWIQYCNGTADSPMGALRAANGHPEPYHVRHWEAGNELWGRWQARWTTAHGYADRYREFAKAMLTADPIIELHACGAPVLWGKDWNDTLIASAGSGLHSITDHPLIGGDVPRATDPLDVYRDFMHVPDILERKWQELSSDMTRGGVRDGRLAVTELQLFAHVGPAGSANKPEKLSFDNLVSPGTLAEALYDTLIYHAAVRLQPFVELITHSATVNHGGGLRKERERVYANPCHYANQLFSEFAGSRPLKVELKCPTERAPMILPDLKNVAGDPSFTAVGALAALAEGGDTLISIVHRGSTGPVRLQVILDESTVTATAQLATLSAPTPWTINSLENPDLVHPLTDKAEVTKGSLTLTIQPCSLVQVRIPGRR